MGLDEKHLTLFLGAPRGNLKDYGKERYDEYAEMRLE
jgi:hypothetical protein